jgi:hypothetical protein
MQRSYHIDVCPIPEEWITKAAAFGEEGQRDTLLPWSRCHDLAAGEIGAGFGNEHRCFPWLNLKATEKPPSLSRAIPPKQSETDKTGLESGRKLPADRAHGDHFRCDHPARRGGCCGNVWLHTGLLDPALTQKMLIRPQCLWIIGASRRVAFVIPRESQTCRKTGTECHGSWSPGQPDCRC